MMRMPRLNTTERGRELLDLHREKLRCVQEIARAVVGVPDVRILKCCELSAAPEQGWLVFSKKKLIDVTNRTEKSAQVAMEENVSRFALQMHAVFPSLTSLSRVLNRVRVAVQIGQLIRAGKLDSHLAVPEDRLTTTTGDPWNVFEIAWESSTFYLAVGEAMLTSYSGPDCSLESRGLSWWNKNGPFPSGVATLNKQVTLPLTLILPPTPILGPCSFIVEQGDQIRIGTMRLTGTICTDRNGGVVMEIESKQSLPDEKENDLPVTVELGELELSLTDLVHMAPGTSIELKRTDPLPCVMRISATAFAHGEIIFQSNRMIILITEIVD